MNTILKTDCCVIRLKERKEKSCKGKRKAGRKKKDNNEEKEFEERDDLK